MSHLDPDVAALLAIGEDVADADLAHLETCPQCREDVASFGRAVTAGRAASSRGDLLTPPDRVWDAISAELAFSTSPASQADSTPAAQPAPSDVAPRGRRRLRRRSVFLMLSAAAIAAVVVVAGVWIGGGILPRAQIVAEATLDGFPQWDGAEGEAALERIDGHTRVVVSLDASLPDDGYREVWLLTSDASDLVSLGILDGGEGSFAVPDDLDLDEFTIVDISQEDSDGDPGHSGDSIVRGALGST